MSDIARLDQLATWMRKVGAVRVHISKTVTEIELGTAPNNDPPHIPKTTDEILAEAKVNDDLRDRYLFAASEGMPDEIDP